MQRRVRWPPHVGAAGFVPRSMRKTATSARCVDDGVQVPRTMRTVGVHLDEQPRAFSQPDPKCIFIRASDPELALPVQHPDAAVGGRKTVCDLARSVRGSVVDDQDVVAEVTYPGDNALDVLLLVERRQHHEDLGRGGAAFGEIAPIRHRRNRIRMTCFSMSIELLTGLTLVSAEFRQTTGTSAILTPCLRARYSTSGS